MSIISQAARSHRHKDGLLAVDPIRAPSPPAGRRSPRPADPRRGGRGRNHLPDGALIK
ncbi:hypothetical protein ACIOHS_48665 [Streptomyces sp. NPDC088253]|uniref:hypothetical protein n=1 Tax=Streptomyces sp. NPDC088253 TaxID=3365846 RepID=UPI003809BCFC